MPTPIEIPIITTFSAKGFDAARDGLYSLRNRIKRLNFSFKNMSAAMSVAFKTKELAKSQAAFKNVGITIKGTGNEIRTFADDMTGASVSIGQAADRMAKRNNMMAKNIGGDYQKIESTLDQYNIAIKTAGDGTMTAYNTMTGASVKYNKAVKAARTVTQGFQMQWLSLMFAAMALNRAMSRVTMFFKSAVETVAQLGGNTTRTGMAFNRMKIQSEALKVSVGNKLAPAMEVLATALARVTDFVRGMKSSTVVAIAATVFFLKTALVAFGAVTQYKLAMAGVNLALGQNTLATMSASGATNKNTKSILINTGAKLKSRLATTRSTIAEYLSVGAKKASGTASIFAAMGSRFLAVSEAWAGGAALSAVPSLLAFAAAVWAAAWPILLLAGVLLGVVYGLKALGGGLKESGKDMDELGDKAGGLDLNIKPELESDMSTKYKKELEQMERDKLFAEANKQFDIIGQVKAVFDKDTWVSAFNRAKAWIDKIFLLSQGAKDAAMKKFEATQPLGEQPTIFGRKGSDTMTSEFNMTAVSGAKMADTIDWINSAMANATSTTNGFNSSIATTITDFGQLNTTGVSAMTGLTNTSTNGMIKMTDEWGNSVSIMDTTFLAMITEIGKNWDAAKAKFEEPINIQINKTITTNGQSSDPEEEVKLTYSYDSKGRQGAVRGDVWQAKFGKQLGGYIGRTGNYLLHAGEKVINPGITPGGSSTDVGGITVNVNANVASNIDIDRLTRAISDKLSREISSKVAI